MTRQPGAVKLNKSNEKRPNDLSVSFFTLHISYYIYLTDKVIVDASSSASAEAFSLVT